MTKSEEYTATRRNINKLKRLKKRLMKMFWDLDVDSPTWKETVREIKSKLKETDILISIGQQKLDSLRP